MTRRYALDVIEGPCKVHGIKVEEKFAESLLEKLNPGGIDVELTYLQVFLDKIYRLAKGKRTGIEFSVPLIEKVGDVIDLLSDFLEEQVGELDDPDTGLVVLKAFVSMQGTRKQIEEEEISDFAMTLGNPIEPEKLNELLNTFVNLRLLRDKDEDGRYELRHDSLATKIYEKITLIEKELLEIKGFIENAYLNFEHRGLHLSKADLKYIAPYEDKLFLNRTLEKFIQESKREIEKSRRRRRNLVATAIITLLILFAGFTIWAMTERKKAIEQSQIAEEQKNDAISARDEANTAREQADLSRQEADEAKDEAIYQQSLTDSALVVAEHQRNLFEQQRDRAEGLFIEADEQRKKAESAQTEAERSAREAIEANRMAMFQLYLFNAKEFAHKSLKIKDNKELKSLLALMSYKLINYGYETFGTSSSDNIYYDPEILEALQTSYMQYMSDTLETGAVWALDSKSGPLVFSSKPGQIGIAELVYSSREAMPEIKMTNTISLPRPSFIRALSVHIQTSNLICGTLDGQILLTNDFVNSTGINILQRQGGNIYSTVLYGNGDKAITSSLNKTITIWDIATGESIRELQLSQPSQKMIVLPGYKLIITNGTNQLLSLDLNDLSVDLEIFHESSAEQGYQAICYNEKLDWLALANGENIQILNLGRTSTDESFINTLPVAHDALISEMEFSADNKWLASASWDGTIMLWNLHPEIRETFDKYIPIIIAKVNHRILSLDFDKESRYLIAGNNHYLSIYPIDIKDLAGKLNLVVGGKELTDSQFKYYIKGELEKPD